MNRADRMLEVLRDGKPRTRHEIFNEAGVYFMTNNAAAELRKRGYVVAQWNHKRENVYQIVSLSEAPAEPPPQTPGLGASLSEPSSRGQADGDSAPPALAQLKLEAV